MTVVGHQGPLFRRTPAHRIPLSSGSATSAFKSFVSFSVAKADGDRIGRLGLF